MDCRTIRGVRHPLITTALRAAAALIAAYASVAAADDSTISTSSVSTAATPPATFIVPNWHAHAQMTTDWCWAASAQSIMHTLGGDVEQCAQANRAFPQAAPRPECCSTPTPNACINPAWPDFGFFGFSATPHDGPLTFEEIKREIGLNHRPFAFTWNWDGADTAHMMVAFGYRDFPGSQVVIIFDPLPPNVGQVKTISYAEYREVPGDHSHSLDYYAIRPATTTAAQP